MTSVCSSIMNFLGKDTLKKKHHYSFSLDRTLGGGVPEKQQIESFLLETREKCSHLKIQTRWKNTVALQVSQVQSLKHSLHFCTFSPLFDLLDHYNINSVSNSVCVCVRERNKDRDRKKRIKRISTAEYLFIMTHCSA